MSRNLLVPPPHEAHYRGWHNTTPDPNCRICRAIEEQQR